MKCDKGWKVRDSGKRQVEANCSCKVRRVRGEMQSVCTWDNWNLSWCERDSSYFVKPSAPVEVVSVQKQQKPSPWIETSANNIPGPLSECGPKIPNMNEFSHFECYNGACRTRCNVREGQKAV